MLLCCATPTGWSLPTLAYFHFCFWTYAGQCLQWMLAVGACFPRVLLWWCRRSPLPPCKHCFLILTLPGPSPAILHLKFKNGALLVMAIDMATPGILQGQVDWCCWRSVMAPLFLSPAFFFWNTEFFLPTHINGHGCHRYFARPCQLCQRSQVGLNVTTDIWQDESGQCQDKYQVIRTEREYNQRTSDKMQRITE